MAKEKAKGAKGVPNKHLHARVAFLQQAATYLALQRCAPGGVNDLSSDSHISRDTTTTHQEEGPHLEAVGLPKIPSPAVAHSSGLPRHLSSQLRQVALKAQIRLDPSTKRAFCKNCNAVLIEGETCSKFTENLSRGGQKPHADMLVLECQACGTKKRFPKSVARQRKKAERSKTSPENPSANAGEVIIDPPR